MKTLKSVLEQDYSKKTKKELIATFKENLMSAIANAELKTKELKTILELVKKNGLD